MIRITQLKLPVTHKEEDLVLKAAKILRISPDSIRSWRIVKKVCGRQKKRGDSFYLYH